MEYEKFGNARRSRPQNTGGSRFFVLSSSWWRHFRQVLRGKKVEEGDGERKAREEDEDWGWTKYGTVASLKQNFDKCLFQDTLTASPNHRVRFWSLSAARPFTPFGR